MTNEESLKAAEQLLSLNPAAMIELYELDLRPVGEDSILYFHNGSLGFRGPVSFKGVSYVPMPIVVTGFDISVTAEPARPKMSISNLGGFTSLLAMSNNDLVGAKLTRRRTWRTFLDDQPGASPVEVEPDIFVVEQRTRETRNVVEFELSSPLDLDGVTFPVRKIVSGYCPFDYRGGDCTWAGRHVVTDSKGNIFRGAAGFVGDWTTTGLYKAPASVGYEVGGVYGVYLCKSATDITGEANYPLNTTHWERVQRDRGEYDATVTDYVKDDVVYVTHIDGNPVKFISVWNGVMPPGASPPNSLFWATDTCAKYLRHCQLRFDPTDKKQNPLSFGGFPGTVNVPTLS